MVQFDSVLSAPGEPFTISADFRGTEMPITFHPKRGTVLICDFGTGFKAPEMVKKRPVVVSRKHRELVTVVPLSTTEPVPVEKCHHELLDASLPLPLRGKRMWAKCDLVTTVGFWRLDRVRGPRHPTTGKRTHMAQPIRPEDLVAIQKAILFVMGLGHLTWPDE